MKPEQGAVVATVNDVEGEISECESAWKRLDHMEAIAAELPSERLVMGRRLVRLRKHWPARGPKAKGWGEALAKIGIPQRTAWSLMEIAGYVEVNDISAAEAETVTYAEAGIDNRPRAADKPIAEPAPRAAKVDAPLSEDERAEIVESNRRHTEERLEAERAHLRIDHRERAGKQWRDAIESMIALKNSLPPITDVSASAEDFATVKNLYYTLYNQVRDDLKRIDALGEPQTPPPKRQLALVPGGAE